MELDQEAASLHHKLPSATDINPSKGSFRQTMYQATLDLEESLLSSYFKPCDLEQVL